ncbi:MAG: hypothetical protein Q9213_004726 [Squamulea squamosa]
MDQRDKQQKKVEPAAKQAASTPLPAHVKTPKPTAHTQSPSQPTPPNLTKKVGFPKNLTRDRGSSYSPPGNDKAVRFSTHLVRGEGSDYSDHNIDRDGSDVVSHCHRVSPQQTPKSTIRNSTPSKQVKHNSMEINGRSKHLADAMDIDVRSESDDSFTDHVDVINIVKTEPEPKGFDPEYDRRLTDITTSRKSPESMCANVSDSSGGFILGSSDNRSYSAHNGTPQKRRNSLPRRDMIFRRNESLNRKGTPTAPTYNRRGHRLRSNPTDNDVLGHSSRRSWPEPIFVWKDRTRTTVLGRQDPAFALREKSDSQNNIQSSGRPVSTKSSRQQSERKYQSPSVIDDTADEASDYDPDP